MNKEDIEIAAAHYEDELHSWHHKTHRDSFEDGASWAMEEIYKLLSENTFRNIRGETIEGSFIVEKLKDDRV